LPVVVADFRTYDRRMEVRPTNGGLTDAGLKVAVA
jgi:hypothetical protein